MTLTTRVVVISAAREAQQSTNTGRLVPLSLVRGEVRVREQGAPPLRGEDLFPPASRPLLLFPGPGSKPLRREAADEGAITLVVPDGTWRASRRIVTRERALTRLDAVHLPPGPLSRYRLRNHPDPHCLATFEAVARALGILEGHAVQQELERVFTLMVERTLWSRGRLLAHDVKGGIPPATVSPGP